MSRFAQPKPSGHSMLLNADSDVPPAGDFMRSSFKKPATTLHTSRSSSLRTLAVPTSLSSSTLTRSSLTLQSSPSLRPLPAKTRGEWLRWLFVNCCVALTFPALPRSGSARSTFTAKWPRSATLLPSFGALVAWTPHAKTAQAFSSCPMEG